MKRFSTIFKAKASKTLDRYQDPRETLDHSYERTLEMLQKMRRAVADVATSRKRVELQAQQLQRSAGKPDGQAKQAIPRYQFQQGPEQVAATVAVPAGQIVARLAGRHLTGQANGGCSNVCTGAINVLIRRSSASPTATSPTVWLRLQSDVTWQTHRSARPRSRSPRLVAWSRSRLSHQAG
jgi:hypothetical protein